MKSFVVLTMFLSSLGYSQGIVTDIRELIPPGYLDVEVVDQNALFPGQNQIVAKAKCRGGLRVGDSLGRNFADRLRPSCDELLFPLGGEYDNEWSIPNMNFSETTQPATVCSYLGFSRAFEQTVLNTTLNCAQIFNQTTTLALQLEYNRCFVAAAESILSLGIKFGSGPDFIDDEYTLIPRDSDDWDAYLADMAAIVTGDGELERSGYLQAACSLGTSHAQRGLDPVNFFDGSRIDLSEDGGDTP